MKALIFGINGQDGFYLSQLLNDNSIEVIGASRSDGNWIQGNIADYTFVSSLIKKYTPEYIFHLAANSTTKHEALFENHETIATGTLNILESVKRFSPNSKVFISGSGLQFKNEGKPIKETDVFEAKDPYSVARIQSVYTARYYRSLEIKTYVGYLFHHESPHRKEHHISKLTSNFIKNISSNPNNKLILGDISVEKEWAYAEDIVEGMFTLINQDEIYEVCIGTGITYSIEDWLKECFALKKLDYKNYIDVAKKSFTPEYNLLVSNTETINKLGWRPKTNFSQLAKIMME
jgi:GDPmannose 4,6-dehydratase